MSRAEDCDPRPHMHVGVCQRAGYANGLADAQDVAGRTVSAEAVEALALELWLLDWSSDRESGETLWNALMPDLMPRRIYSRKAERLIAIGYTLAATAPAHDEAVATIEYGVETKWGIEWGASVGMSHRYEYTAESVWGLANGRPVYRRTRTHHPDQFSEPERVTRAALAAPTAAEQATDDLDSHDDPPRRPLGPREPGGES